MKVHFWISKDRKPNPNHPNHPWMILLDGGTGFWYARVMTGEDAIQVTQRAFTHGFFLGYPLA